MRMKKKSLIMLISALTIIFSVAFGTIAYLTDQAGVTNRFTIGNVDIVVDETKVDENGNPIPNPDHDPSDPNDTDAPTCVQKMRTSILSFWAVNTSKTRS